MKTWKLIKLIVKQGCDLKQEQFATQLISQFDQIFKAAKLNIWLKPYEILCTGPNCGLVECVSNTISFSSLNKKLMALKISGLSEFFMLYYPTKKLWRTARYNFAKSLAGYSLLCYLLNIKDRHNENILLDTEGHIIHIDFDFFLTNSPGGNIEFEQAAFKMTKEYIEVMNGVESKCFKKFKSMLAKGFIAIQKEYRRIMALVEMMLRGNKHLPCFFDDSKVMNNLKERFFPKIEGVDGDSILNFGEATRFIDQ